MVRSVVFYTTSTGKCPVQEFLEKLSDKQAEKILWVIRLVSELDMVPASYFKKLPGTDGIWEVRIIFGGNIFRILGFMIENSFVILTNGFHKKSQETPRSEIDLATDRKKEFQNRR